MGRCPFPWSVSACRAIIGLGARRTSGASAVSLATTVRSERFVFEDLRALFAKANEEKSGDRLAGIAAASERERVAAKRVLADLTLAEIVDRPLIDPDADEVSGLIAERHDRRGFASISGMTVGQFREYLLDDD